MLSQVKRRLLYPIFLENTFVPILVARFSSKKEPNEPFVSVQESKSQSKDEEGGIPDDIFEEKLIRKKVYRKQGQTKTADQHSHVFDAVLQASLDQNKNKTHRFPKSKHDQHSDVYDAVLQASLDQNKNQKNRFSKSKPGQLNIQMAKAANSVADMAGQNREEVLGDIMDKLETVFPGMENHVKGKRKYGKANKKSAEERKRKLGDEINFEEIVGMAVNQKGPRQRFQEGTKTDTTGSEIDDEALAGAFQSNFSRPQRFVGQPFTSLDKLLKSQEPLKIFTSKLSPSSSLSMWEKFEEAQVQRLTKFEPLNWFDQCIRWTEEGKLWHFPIDNEQGMDKEAEVDFTEHIFLDHHAASWCPKEGPIKYFMELVLVGLSKNAFLTVQEKKETIDWYRDYFTKHKSLLEEINAFGSPQNPIDVEGKMS